MEAVSVKRSKWTEIITLYDGFAFLFVVALFVFENARYSGLFQIIQAGFIGMTVLVLLQRDEICLSRIYLWVGSFCVLAFVLSLLFGDTTSTFSIIFKNVVRCFCFSVYLGNGKNNEKAVWYFAIAGVICAGYLLMEYIAADLSFANLRYASNDRIGASIAGGNVNIVALNMSFSFTAWLFIQKAQANLSLRRVATVCMVAVAGLSLLTGTRKILLYYVVVFVLYNLFLNDGKKQKLLFTLLFLLFGYYCVLNIEPLYYLIGHKIDFWGNRSGTQMYQVSDNIRERLIAGGMALFYDHPFFGIGFGNPAKHLGLYAHNNFVEMLAAGGIIGFAAYYASYAYILVKTLQFRKEDQFALYLFASVLGLLVLEYFQVTYLYGMPWIFLTVAMDYSESRCVKPEEPARSEKIGCGREKRF